MKRYLEWAKKEYSPKQRMVIHAFAGVLIVLVVPYLIIIASRQLDRSLKLPVLTAGAVNPILGAILVIAGLALGLWSNYAQITIGNGTPVPLMPTRKLVVKPPFTYCRNPMTLGTYIAYLGLVVWTGSITALAIVLILVILLLLYLKLVEEKELEARFGAEYLEYKRSTPFMLPRFRPH